MKLLTGQFSCGHYIRNVDKMVGNIMSDYWSYNTTLTPF